MTSSETLRYGLLLFKQSDCFEIKGQTYDNRDLLKSLGAKWNPERKAWILPLTTDLSSLKLPPPPPRQTPVRKLKKVFRTWICDKKQAQLDPYNPQGPMIWVCSCCGTYKSDYDGT